MFIEDRKLFGCFKRSYSGIVWHSQAQIQRKELEMGDGGSCGGAAAAGGGGACVTRVCDTCLSVHGVDCSGW